ncbi:SDR family NAD(P)-dependent oxidoreductase [Micromonospora saelicesensis]|uniref:SDR family NAD(P)-dependent oxidoreductase n=1 Tax=Micromonospora saelicesensis TaxID=285676 RepID=UPI003CFA5791
MASMTHTATCLPTPEGALVRSSQRVLITGAASGIGRAGAHLFAERGANVILLDRDPGGEEVAAKIRAAGGCATFLPCDVSDERQVAEAFAAADGSGQPLTGLWSNAGVAHFQSLAETSLEAWNAIIATNLTGAFLVTRTALPVLADGASILYTGSISSVRAAANFGPYCASKGGLLMLAKSMAIELAPRRIRVNVIAPGAVDTPMQHADMMSRPVSYNQAVAEEIAAHPLGRYASPEEVAESAYFLMSERASFTTGTILMVDGGFSA